MTSDQLVTAYGFVGTGEITAAIVEGIHTDAADSPAIFLSPRGHDVARELAGRYANVQVCDSNQRVLDSASTVVVAVRPQVGRDVLDELSFRAGHVVLSVMAGVQLEQLREWVAPTERLVRVIPLPSAARGRSLTTIFPDDPVARDLFGRVGEVLVPSDEATFDALSAATATFAAHLDYLATIAGWLTDNGLDADAAAAFTTHIFGQLGQTLSQQSHSLTELTDKHMTPGGTNQQFMTDLRRDGVPDSVRRALDRILARLRG
jgi:pyrroline-5-carboxylate reductase